MRRTEDELRVAVPGRRDLEIVRGLGAWLFDREGRAFLDFGVSYGACNLGHCHPAIVHAIQEQASRLVFVGGSVRNDVRAQFLAALLDLAPTMSRAFLCNSGTESVEAALKFARSATGRPRFVAAMRSFHGRTFGSLSVTWRREYREGFEPLLRDVEFVPFNDAEALKGAVGRTTAGVILEPVQGEGGVHVAESQFLGTARDLCEDRGALLILDEVQTGIGRTGRVFAFERFGVAPDILCLAKSLGGGFPLGATLVTESVAKGLRGSHHSTFGGGPLACAAGTAALRVLLEERLPERAETLGARFLGELRNLEEPSIREVRGIGLMAAVELRRKSASVLQEMMERGVLAIPGGLTTLRFLPPLVVTEAEIRRAVAALREALVHE